MQKLKVGDSVRILTKRASPDLPCEVGIIREVYPFMMSRAQDVTWKHMPPPRWMYKVETLENCPPMYDAVQDLGEDELELLT